MLFDKWSDSVSKFILTGAYWSKILNEIQVGKLLRRRVRDNKRSKIAKKCKATAIEISK